MTKGTVRRALSVASEVLLHLTSLRYILKYQVLSSVKQSLHLPPTSLLTYRYQPFFVANCTVSLLRQTLQICSKDVTRSSRRKPEPGAGREFRGCQYVLPRSGLALTQLRRWKSSSPLKVCLHAPSPSSADMRKQPSGRDPRLIATSSSCTAYVNILVHPRKDEGLQATTDQNRR